MKIKFVYPLWGSSHLPLKDLILKIKAAGYSALEMNIPIDKNYTEELLYVLEEQNITLVAQQWLAPHKESLEEYADKMEKYLYHLASFQPVFINSHTGRDYYSFEQNCKLFSITRKVSKDTGIKIIHETHRGRALYSPIATNAYFRKFPDLRINADFSHWCCVSESLLQEHDDFLKEAIVRSDYIHARVGSEQAPQVNHPAAPENKKALDAHLDWWSEIVNLHETQGDPVFYVCTEFGPEPYLPTLPFTNKATGDQWEINLYMKDLLQTKLISKK